MKLKFAGIVLLAGIAGCTANHEALPLKEKAINKLENHINEDVIAAAILQCKRPKEDCPIESVYPINNQFDAAGYSLDKTIQKILTEKQYQINQRKMFGELLLGVYYSLNKEHLRNELLSKGVISQETVDIFLKQKKA